MEFIKKVIFLDERGFEHEVNSSNKIGEGGQGQVFKSKNENILVKIAPKGDMKASVDRIRSLNLENLNFALPLSNLKKFNDTQEGYVMRIMEDMYPISKMMKNSFKNSEELYKYYFEETGGIHKRLEVLKEISFNLYNLHSRGLVYGDISENNIFVSKSANLNDSWFIDCDNIDYFYNIDSAIGSRGFASPEIMKYLMGKSSQKQTSTVENDIFAFANLFVNLIFLCDPFRGTIIKNKSLNNDKGWDDDEDEELTLDEKIDCGMISWIGEGDENNKPIYGFSIQMDRILTPELKELLNNTLGYKGRNNPELRPSMRIWYEEINNLLNSLKIFECDHSFYKINDVCLKCGSLPKKFLELEVDYGKNKKSKRILRTIIGQKYVFQLTYGDLSIGLFDKAEDSIIEFEKNGHKYLVKNRFNSNIDITYDDELEGQIKFILKPNKKDQVSKFQNLLIEIPEINMRIKVSR